MPAYRTINSSSVIPANQHEAETVIKPQTFAADIFVPLVQNIIGGIAVALLCAILTITVSLLGDWQLDLEILSIWCVLVGGFVACVVTVVRFFGDDIGVVRQAYKRGRHSMQLRVNALELELETTRSQLAQVLGKSKAIPNTKALQDLERVYQAAQHLIHWHFEALPIDRRSCEQRNMSQGDWRRARHLLLTAGVMDADGITTRTLAEALRQADVHYKKAVRLGENARNFISPH